MSKPIDYDAPRRPAVEVDDGVAVAGVDEDESPGQSRRESCTRFDRRLVVVAVVESPHSDRYLAGDPR